MGIKRPGFLTGYVFQWPLRNLAILILSVPKDCRVIWVQRGPSYRLAVKRLECLNGAVGPVEGDWVRIQKVISMTVDLESAVLDQHGRGAAI